MLPLYDFTDGKMPSFVTALTSKPSDILII